MPCGREGNRRSGVALAMCHRLQWFSHLRAHGLRKGGRPPHTHCVVWAGARAQQRACSVNAVVRAWWTRTCAGERPYRAHQRRGGGHERLQADAEQDHAATRPLLASIGRRLTRQSRRSHAAATFFHSSTVSTVVRAWGQAARFFSPPALRETGEEGLCFEVLFLNYF